MFLGEIASLGAACSWAIAVCLFRAHGKSFPAEFANLYKCFLGLVCMWLTIMFLNIETPSDPRIWIGLAASGLFGLVIGDTAFFASLARLGAQISAALQTLSAPFAAIIAYCFLNESLKTQEILGMSLTCLALMGAIAFSQKKGSSVKIHTRATLIAGIFLAVLSALMQAIGVVISRAYMQEVDAVYGSFMRLAPSVMILLVWNVIGGYKKSSNLSKNLVPASVGSSFAPRSFANNILPTKNFHGIAFKQWLWVAVAAIVGTYIGTVLGSLGVKHSKAAISSVLSSVYPLWVVPIAWIFLNEKTNRATVFCIVLAVFGMCLMFV